MKNISLLLFVFLIVACNSPSAQEKSATATNTITPNKPQPTTVQTKSPQPTNTDIHTANSKIKWMSLEEAQRANVKAPKKFFIDVYTKWCGPCKMLDRNTFSDDKIAAYVNENFYPVKFDAESPQTVAFNGRSYANPNYNPAVTRGRNAPHQLTQAIGIRGYPTIVILNPDLKVANKIVGYKTPDQLMQSLNTL